MRPLPNALSRPPSNRPLRKTPPKLSPIFDGALSSASCIQQVRPPAHHVLHHYFDNNCNPQPDGTVILSLASDRFIRIITITSPSGTWLDPFASLLAEIPLEGCVASFIIRPSIEHVLPFPFLFGVCALFPFLPQSQTCAGAARCCSRHHGRHHSQPRRSAVEFSEIAFERTYYGSHRP